MHMIIISIAAGIWFVFSGGSPTRIVISNTKDYLLTFNFYLVIRARLELDREGQKNLIR